MFKQSPSRNQRSKGGFKVKHALQIGVLLAVCIWLLYQVKHSHDKKKAFDESNAQVSEKLESDHELIRLGRKDLIPRVEEAVILNGQQNEDEGTEEDEEETKHEDVEDEETKHEEVEEEEDTKHEDVDEDGEEKKHDEVEEEAKGDSDDAAEEQDREVSEEDTKIDEDEEEKEIAEREEREKEDQIADVDHSRNTQEAREQETANEDQIDHQDHDMNTQEAREEQYKGDDASSAVRRDTQLLNSDTENGVSEKSNEEENVEKTDSGELGLQNQSNSTEVVDAGQKDNNLKTEDLENVEYNRSLNVTNGEEKNSGIMLSESVEDLNSNSTANVEFIDQQVNSSVPIYGRNSSSLTQNETDVTQDQIVVAIPSSSGDPNLQTTVSDQTENSSMASDKVESVSNSTLLTTTENANATNVESADGQTMKSEITREDAGNSVTSVTNEKNINGDQKDKPETTSGTEEKDINGATKDGPGTPAGTEGTSNSVTSVTDEKSINGDQKDKVETTTGTEVNGTIVAQKDESGTSAGTEGTSNTATSVTDEKSINGDHKDEPETTTGTEGTEENSTTYEDPDSVEIKSADSNDNLIPEVREAVTDLGTLPEIATEGTNSEDASEK